MLTYNFPILIFRSLLSYSNHTKYCSSLFLSCSLKMYSQLSKNYISFPILIIITTTIILTNLPNHAYARDDEQYRACSDSQPFQCANLQNVRYPFWEPSRPEYCGRPEFKLNCSSSTAAEITIKSVAYRVLNMRQDTHTLTVARADYWGDSCSGDRKDATLDDTLFEYSSGTQNLTLYYRCTLGMYITPDEPRFSCPNSTNYFVTETFSRAAAFSNINVGACGENVVVHISDSSADNLESAEANLTSALVSGFGIEWSLNESQCGACLISEGICGSDNVTKAFTCYCKDGPSNSSICNSSPSPEGSPGMCLFSSSFFVPSKPPKRRNITCVTYAFRSPDEPNQVFWLRNR